MRWLVALVSVMGVLIMVGVAVVAVTIAQRAGLGSAAAPSDLLLNEPPGTRIAGTASLGDRLAITLSGGGPDRIAIVDTRHGRTLAHISLSR